MTDTLFWFSSGETLIVLRRESKDEILQNFSSIDRNDGLGKLYIAG